MIERFNRLVSSKLWSYFWIGWAVTYLVTSIIAGNVPVVIFLIVFLLWEGYILWQKTAGKHYWYNKYFGNEATSNN